MRYSETIRRARRNQDITQEQIAEALGFSKTVISDLERNRPPAKLETVVKVIQFLKLEPRTLLADIESAVGPLDRVFRDYDVVMASLQDYEQVAS